ncbi:MAG: hypothetical protein Q8R16_02275, partial [bacterium]|nr:hypothetical protein [bacterium]
MGRASEDEQRRRRMELLATLDHLGGEAESLTALHVAATREHGDRHRVGTAIVDSKALADSKLIEKRRGRAHGRLVAHITITANGRRALARYRDAHDGAPKPPALTDIGAAAPAAAVPKGPRVGLSELSRAVLGEFALHNGAPIDLATVINALLPTQGFAAPLDRKKFAQTVRFRCRDLRSSGYLERFERGGYRITQAGSRVIGTASAPPPNPTAPPAPTAAPTPPALTLDALGGTISSRTPAAAPTQPNGPLPEPVRAIDADIGSASEEIARLGEQRAALERQIEDLDRLDLQIAQRRTRLEQLRKTTLEAYASDVPPTTPSDAPPKT